MADTAYSTVRDAARISSTKMMGPAENRQERGPVTRAIRAVRTEPEPARRGILRALAALPLAVAALTGPAAALPSPDAELIQVCNAATAMHDSLNQPGVATALGDEGFDARLREVDSLVEVAIATPATTPEGLAAKARILMREHVCTWPHLEDLDAEDLMIRSLVRDLVRNGGRV